MTLTLSLFSLLSWTCGWILFRARNPIHPPLKEVKLDQLSIIIPARNEEKNLPALLISLQSDIQALEVLVVNDHSTDSTVEIAMSYGAKVIHSTPLPAQWSGKSWACWQGVQASSRQILLFLDSDTRFQKNGLKRFFSEFLARENSALSVLPYHSVSQTYEQLSAFFNIFMCIGTVHSQRLTGQSLMVRRSDYFAVGGHSKVSKHVLENFFLTDPLNSAGIQTNTLLGDGILQMRMFPEGIHQLIEGWTKAFIRGSHRVSLLNLALIVAWISGFFSPLSLFSYSELASLIAYLGFAVQLGYFLRRLGSYSHFTALLYPLPLIFYVAICGVSALRNQLGITSQWRGREV